MTMIYRVELDVTKFAKEMAKYAIHPASVNGMVKRILDDHMKQYIRLYRLGASMTSSEVFVKVEKDVGASTNL
jgi:hypothetical protein